MSFLLTLLPLAFCAAAGTLVFVYYTTYRRAAYARLLYARLNNVRANLNEYEERGRVVSSVAADYFLSLGKDGMSSLNALNSELRHARAHCDSIAQLIREESWESLQAAENALRARFEKHAAATGARWEDRAEALIQRLGKRIILSATESSMASDCFSPRTVINFKKLGTAGVAFSRG